MSWWIYLERDGEAVEVDCHSEGGTRAAGGTGEAELNVTYNYSAVTRLVGFNFRDSLSGKRAGDTIEELTRVVGELGDRPYDDYWAPTPGNAGHAAAILLGWAHRHPDAIWRVS